MRMIVTICAAFAVLAGPVKAAPTHAEDAALLQVEAPGDRESDRWQGRHHYLYDDEHQPGPSTVGSAPADARACAREPVRLRRSDGTTVVRRLKRCD